jgi:bacterioferritin
MTSETLIASLNDDLALEFRSIVQYIQHTATLTGPEYQSTTVELRKHLTEEVQHASILAEQISFLGGTPTTHVPDVPSCTSSEESLKLDLELEEQQLDRYRTRVEEATDAGLPDVAEALRPVLEQTQDHVRDLRGALGI